MLNHKGNLIISIVKSIFTTAHLALISTGLVGCVVEVPQPPAPSEQQLPSVQPKQQPNQTKQNDHDNDKEHDNDNDKDDDDKD